MPERRLAPVELDLVAEEGSAGLVAEQSCPVGLPPAVLAVQPGEAAEGLPCWLAFVAGAAFEELGVPLLDLESQWWLLLVMGSSCAEEACRFTKISSCPREQ